MTPLRLLGLFALVGALTVGAFSYRERARLARLDATAAAQRQLAATRLAPAGSAPQAGISARANIEVREFPSRLANSLHDDADFHHLVHRCGVCHSTPDPSLHTAEEWDGVLDRMSAHIEAAGLLPLTADQRAAVRRVLTRHATSRQ